MPKSRNRKGHKNKVRKRKLRLINERNAMIKRFKAEQEAKMEAIKADIQASVENATVKPVEAQAA